MGSSSNESNSLIVNMKYLVSQLLFSPPWLMPPPRLKLRLKPQLMPTMATTAVDTDTDMVLDMAVDTTVDTMATTAVDTDTDMVSMVPDITVMEPDTTATTVMPVTVTPPMPTAVSTSVKLKPNLRPKPPLMLTMATTVMLPAATSTAAPKV